MLTPFITEEQVKGIASLSSSIESQFLAPYIMVAQDIAIVPVLGIALSTELSNQILSGNTTTDNQYLIDNYVLLAQAYKSWELATPFLSIKAYKKSLVKPVDPNSEALSIDEIKFYKANITGMVNFYLKQLFDFLELDSLSLNPKYPLYRSTNNPSEFRSEGNATSGFYFKYRQER